MLTVPRRSSSYFVDRQDGAEIACLMHQDRLLTEQFGGLFPQQLEIVQVRDVLDLACGPGGWALDVAFTIPTCQVLGIDLRNSMVRYANARSYVQRLSNVSFEQMDILQTQRLAEASFDLIQGRMLNGIILDHAWPAFLQDCRRVLRPGGRIVLTETETAWSNSDAFITFFDLYSLAMERSGCMAVRDIQGRGFGERASSILHQEGYQHIQYIERVIDFSADKPAHVATVENLIVACTLLAPLFIALAVLTPREIEKLLFEMSMAPYSSDFASTWTFSTVWGEKRD